MKATAQALRDKTYRTYRRIWIKSYKRTINYQGKICINEVKGYWRKVHNKRLKEVQIALS